MNENGPFFITAALGIHENTLLFINAALVMRENIRFFITTEEIATEFHERPCPDGGGGFTAELH